MERHRQRDHHGHVARRSQRCHQRAVRRPPLGTAAASASFIGKTPPRKATGRTSTATRVTTSSATRSTSPRSPPSIPPGESTYTWTTTSSDPRALQTPGSSNRVAAVWYASTSFTIAVNLADGQAHDIALYALDWDNRGRSEQIQISKPPPARSWIRRPSPISRAGSISSGRSPANVIITVTRLAGANAVINGLFVDPRAHPGRPSQLNVSARRP